MRHSVLFASNFLFDHSFRWRNIMLGLSRIHSFMISSKVHSSMYTLQSLTHHPLSLPLTLTHYHTFIPFFPLPSFLLPPPITRLRVRHLYTSRLRREMSRQSNTFTVSTPIPTLPTSLVSLPFHKCHASFTSISRS